MLLLASLLQLLLLLQQNSASAQSLKRSVYIKEHAVYRDFVPLSSANLTEISLRDETAWVIHVHDGFIDPEVKQTAGKYRGLVRFGLIEVSDKEALDMMKFDPARHYFRSLPFGWETRKRSKFLDTEGFLAALEHAAASVPAEFLTVLRTEKETKAVLAEAIASKPSRFTVLFTVKGDQPTLLHRVLSRKLIRNFNFALLPNADEESALKTAGLSGLTLPVQGMAVLMVSKAGAVRSSRMPTSDGLHYANVLRFLIEFNGQFRAELPGDARSSDQQILYMSDILDSERLIFQVEDAAAAKNETGNVAKEDGAEKSETTGEDLKEEL